MRFLSQIRNLIFYEQVSLSRKQKVVATFHYYDRELRDEPRIRVSIFKNKKNNRIWTCRSFRYGKKLSLETG